MNESDFLGRMRPKNDGDSIDKKAKTPASPDTGKIIKVSMGRMLKSPVEGTIEKTLPDKPLPEWPERIE